MKAIRTELLALCALGVHAANGQSTFSRTYGQGAFLGGGIMPDSGVVLAFENGLIRTDATGQPLWRKTYNSIGLGPGGGGLLNTPWDSWFRDVAAMGDTAIMAVGHTISTDPNSTSSHQFLQCVVDPSGDPLYSRQLGGTFGQYYYFAQAVPGDRVVVGGAYNGLAGNTGRAHLVATGDTGFPEHQGNAIMTGAAFIGDACPLPLGGYLLAEVRSDGGLYFRKVDAAFNGVAQCRVPGQVTGVQVAAAPDGSGYGLNSGVTGQVDLVHFDTLCVPLWHKRYTIFSDTAAATDLFVRPNGRVVVSGRDWVMQLAPDGTIDHVQQYAGHTIRALEMVPGDQGHYLIGSVGNDGWLMRVDTSGLATGCAVAALTAQSVDVPLGPSGANTYPTFPWGSVEHSDVATTVVPSSLLECGTVEIDPIAEPGALRLRRDGDRLFVEAEQGERMVALRVFDMQGRCVAASSFAPRQQAVVSLRDPGVAAYFVHAMFVDGRSHAVSWVGH